LGSPEILEADTDQLKALSQFYQLLSRVWLNEADAALLELLQSPDVRPLFEEAGGRLPTESENPEERQTEEQQKVLDELAIDYCRLLLGPRGHFPPYQSVWQTGQFQGTAVTGMREFIGLLACEPALGVCDTMPDHLAVQLRVMGVIADRMATAEAPAARALLVDVARGYFERHLSWPQELLESVAKNAETDFYRSVAQMTEAFLQTERTAWFGE